MQFCIVCYFKSTCFLQIHMLLKSEIAYSACTCACNDSFDCLLFHHQKSCSNRRGFELPKPSKPSKPSFLQFFRHVRHVRHIRHVRHVSQLEVKRQAHMQEVMVAESWMPPMPVEERNFIAVNAAQNPASESVSQIEMKLQRNCTKSVRIRSTRKNHMLFYLTTEQHMHKDHPGSSPMSTEKSNFQ